MSIKIFQNIGGLFPRRSPFNLSYAKKFTGDMGKMYPILCEEVVPGDTFKVGNNIVVRFQPLVAPTLHNINAKVHYFFVPYRLLWSKMHNDEFSTELTSDWETFITGGEDGLDDSVVPRFVPDSADKSAKGTLWDLFGFPLGLTWTSSAPQLAAGHDNAPLIFPFAAYNLIYNEYYRDENLQDPVELDQPKILNCCWSKDYFTASLPWQQRGVSPSLPLVGLAPVQSYSTSYSGRDLIGRIAIGSDTVPGQGKFVSSWANSSAGIGQYMSRSWNDVASLNGESNRWSNFWFPGTNPGQYQFSTKTEANSVKRNFNTVSTAAPSDPYTVNFDAVDGSNFTTFNIADLRLAFQIQKWLERNARGGVRYTEFLRAHFGVSPRDDRLQRPEYIGGSKSPVIISEVLQTSSTDSTSPQGNLAGHGLVADGNFCSQYTATEYGLIMGILTIIPDTEYQQGINRQWLRRTRYDFFSPEFANLSEQAVEECEIYAKGGESFEADDLKIFGYIGRFDEMRTKQNMTCSGMRDTFDYWHLGRKFDAPPNLNSTFVKCEPSKRIFAVQNEDTLIIQFYNKVRAVRPLPAISDPGLIDHNY